MKGEKHTPVTQATPAMYAPHHATQTASPSAGGCAWQEGGILGREGWHGRGGTCMPGGMHGGRVHGWGSCVAGGGHIWQGVCMAVV